MTGTTPAKIPHDSKPQKPYEDFPLFAHASGQWAKKIRGKLVYFGVWSDWEAAYNLFKDQEGDLRAGRMPSKGDGLSVKDLVNSFLTYKKARVKGGELSARSFTDYHDVCERVFKEFGRATKVASLKPFDFEKLRASFATTHGVERLGKDITVSRMLFKYADEAFDVRVKFGPDFKKPSTTEVRRNKKNKPKKMFAPEQLRAVLDTAGVQLKAMILLGVNCGLGNQDIACLTSDRIDGEWMECPRTKTEIERRAWLWPETRKALAAATAARPEPKKPADAERVFITAKGHTWEPDNVTDKGLLVVDNPISKAFAKVLDELGIREKGVNFYALRHTFQTIGEKGQDKDAVRAIMGHAPRADDMAARYSEEGPSDERLKAVAQAVRVWLYGKRKPK